MLLGLQFQVTLEKDETFRGVN